MHSLFRAASTLGCPDPEHGLESMGGPLWKTAGCRGPHLSLPPAGAAVVAVSEQIPQKIRVGELHGNVVPETENRFYLISSC